MDKPARIAQDWLGRFETALRTGDGAGLRALFHPDCHWRDLLAFAWDIRTVSGADAVVSSLQQHAASTQAHGFRIDPQRTPPRQATRAGERCIEAIFAFESAAGPGAGVRAPFPGHAESLDAADRALRARGARRAGRPAAAEGPGVLARFFRAELAGPAQSRQRIPRTGTRRCSSSAAATRAFRSPRASRSAASTCWSSTAASALATTGASAITRSRCTTRCTSITCRTCRSRRTGRSTSRKTSSPTGSSRMPRRWSSTTGPPPNSRAAPTTRSEARWTVTLRRADGSSAACGRGTWCSPPA